MRFDFHLFICANQKGEGKACCGEQAGMALVEKFREVLKEKGLQAMVRAQRSGCLDACKFGPALVIYPDGTYYQKVQLEDVNRIIETHILNKEIVKDLELVFPLQNE